MQRDARQRPRSLNWRWGAVAVLGLLVLLKAGSEFSGRGASYWHQDLAALSREQATFYHRVYPHVGVAPAVPGIGPVRTDYPPYAFWLMAAWVPPGLNWTAVQYWFTACQALAAAVILAFAIRASRMAGPGAGWLVGASVVAMTAVRADLLFGNFALITTALLVLLQAGCRAGRWRGAGAAWMAAMLKPQMGWLFAIMLAGRRGRRTLATAVAVLAGFAVLTCIWTRVTPGEIVRSSYANGLLSMVTMAERLSLPSLLVQGGMPAMVALVLAATAGLGAVLYGARRGGWDEDRLASFALVGLVNRICTYHNRCDDLLLVFALVWLGRRAWARGTTADWAWFAALGATVWLPTVATAALGVRLAIVATWVACTAWIFRATAPVRRGHEDGTVASLADHSPS